MTREELKDLSPKPGTRMLVKDHFVETPHEDLYPYLGTVLEMERIEMANEPWIYFKDVPQPFAASEVECVVGGVDTIDESDYDVTDMSMIFGEVAS